MRPVKRCSHKRLDLFQPTDIAGAKMENINRQRQFFRILPRNLFFLKIAFDMSSTRHLSRLRFR
jgi:hypothetical protein